MEKEEELVLKNLQWKGKGLIKSAYDSVADEVLQAESSDGKLFYYIFHWYKLSALPHEHSLVFFGARFLKSHGSLRNFTGVVKNIKQEGGLNFYNPKSSYIFCDFVLITQITENINKLNFMLEKYLWGVWIHDLSYPKSRDNERQIGSRTTNEMKLKNFINWKFCFACPYEMRDLNICFVS